MVSRICGENNSGSIAFKMYTEQDPSSITYTPIQNGRLRRHSNTATSPTYIATSPKTAHQKRLNRTTDTTNQNRTQVNPHLNKLIISNSTEHSVTELCKSKTSVGPDFANINSGKFCRMEDKTIWPICAPGHKTKCFNIKSKQLEVGGKATRDTPTYIDIGDWTV